MEDQLPLARPVKSGPIHRTSRQGGDVSPSLVRTGWLEQKEAERPPPSPPPQNLHTPT